MQHWLLDVVRAFDAFVYNDEDSPVLFYSLLSDGKNVAKTLLYNLETFCADSIMVISPHLWFPLDESDVSVSIHRYTVCIMSGAARLRYASCPCAQL